MTGVSQQKLLSDIGQRNIDHYPFLIKTIFKPQGVRFSSDNGLAQGGTPSTSVPRQQISIRIVQKSFNKKPPPLHFSVSCILLVPQVLTGGGRPGLCGVWTLISSLVYLISLEAAF